MSNDCIEVDELILEISDYKKENDIYLGIMKNATLANAPAMTDLIELAKNDT